MQKTIKIFKNIIFFLFAFYNFLWMDGAIYRMISAYQWRIDISYDPAVSIWYGRSREAMMLHELLLFTIALISFCASIYAFRKQKWYAFVLPFVTLIYMYIENWLLEACFLSLYIDGYGCR